MHHASIILRLFNYLCSRLVVRRETFSFDSRSRDVTARGRPGLAIVPVAVSAPRAIALRSRFPLVFRPFFPLEIEPRASERRECRIQRSTIIEDYQTRYVSSRFVFR